jgi:hypothetical protein
VLDEVGRIARAMRARGASVGVDQVLTAHRALAAVEPRDFGHALRATLCSSQADLARLEAALAPPPGGRSPLGGIEREVLPRVALPAPTSAVDLELELEAVPAPWSDDERLRPLDFAAYTDAERAAARRLLARIAARGPVRTSRRTRPARRGRRPDLRATARASLRHGGELRERRWRAPGVRPRRVVLILDVSGSMAPYARVLLQYVHASVAGGARVEAFAFGTRLTRLTPELAGRDPDPALARASERVADWSGGTRIGESLATLNREHGGRVGRGAFVVLLSDGWDRGDPEQLGEELARLRRTAHRLVWLNPLAADPRYAPLTRGMRAAMPHVDRLLPGNSIASLEQLADLMESAQ